MFKFFRKLKLINELNVSWLEGLNRYELWDDLDYPLMKRIKDLIDREDALRVEVEKLNDRLNGGETGGSIPKILEQKQLERLDDLENKFDTLDRVVELRWMKFGRLEDLVRIILLSVQTKAKNKKVKTKKEKK